jgi:hypothetical protein
MPHVQLCSLSRDDTRACLLCKAQLATLLAVSTGKVVHVCFEVWRHHAYMHASLCLTWDMSAPKFVLMFSNRLQWCLSDESCTVEQWNVGLVQANRCVNVQLVQWFV